MLDVFSSLPALPVNCSAMKPCRSLKAQERFLTVLGALGIVVNLVVLWNTIYMDAALDRLRAEGQDVLPADVARQSPLGFKHINMLGRYAFTLPEMVARGKLRPLRDPGATGVGDA